MMKATKQDHAHPEVLGDLMIKRNFKHKPLGIVFVVLVMLLLILLMSFPRLSESEAFAR